MDQEFQVEVVHRQRAVYRIKAPDREAAERLAAERWRRGDGSDVPGFAWSEMASCVGQPAADEARIREDAEIVHRFLSQRERLLEELGPDPFSPSANDAISAAQVAANLGWGIPSADVTRATLALERLCTAHRAVCFARPRMRGSERGEIRLYCTPEYLERLTAALEVLEPQEA